MAVARDPAATSVTPAAQARAAREWAALRARLRTVTPQAVARIALVTAVIGGSLWLATATWPALAPFLVGGLIAYQLLPVVDALDRVMPRFLAALISVVATVAAIVAIVVIVLPPLVSSFVRLAVDLPSQAEVDAAIVDLQGQLGALPDGASTVVAPIVTSVLNSVRGLLTNASGGFDDLVRAVVAGLLNAVGALLGLIVLPTWMLTLMTQHRRARTAIDARVAPWLRRDAWALVAIADRATGSYLRGYVLTGALVGILAYIGLQVSPRVGGPEFAQPLPIAVLAGVSQVVPIVGPFLGLVPGLLILPASTERAVAYFVVYLGARVLGGTLLGSRIQGRRLNVHPAILVPGVVALGQFGIVWLLLSAPLIAVLHDVLRYVHGRLSDPARPAGVLPGEPLPVTGARAPGAGVASAYRRAIPPAPLPQATVSATATPPAPAPTT
jgi:predicted PurR-regulated permease PerM